MNELPRSLSKTELLEPFIIARKFWSEKILKREELSFCKNWKTRHCYFYPEMDLYSWIYRDRFSILLEFENKTYTITWTYEITLNNSSDHKKDDKTKTVEEKNIRIRSI